jgi:Protein of unknown function (DUF935)
VKWWTEWNFPGAVPPRVYRQTEPAADLNARAERDTMIFALGYEPEEDYILETYGKGWKEKAPAPVPPALAGFMPGQPGGEPEAGDAGQDFAENEPAALAALRAARRGDQQAIFNAAQLFAGKYRTVMGKRVEQLLQAAEFSEDPDTFMRRLDELLAEAPSDSTMEKLTRAFASSRLLAAMRGQRRRPQ